MSYRDRLPEVNSVASTEGYTLWRSARMKYGHTFYSPLGASRTAWVDVEWKPGDPLPEGIPEGWSPTCPDEYHPNVPKKAKAEADAAAAADEARLAKLAADLDDAAARAAAIATEAAEAEAKAMGARVERNEHQRPSAGTKRR